MTQGDLTEPRSSANRLIFRAAVWISAAMVALRLLGFLKNLVIAEAYGVGPEVETYFLAAILPTFAFGALGNTLPSALVPAYAASRAASDERAARELTRDVVGWSAVALLSVALLLLAVWPVFLRITAGDLSPEGARRTTAIFHALLPVVPLHGMAMVGAALLKAEKRFLRSVVAMGTIPIAIALCVLLLASRWGAYALVAGHVVGVLLELLLVGRFVRALGLSLVPRGLPRVTPEVREVLGQYLPALGGGLLMNGTTMIDRSMAAGLPEGSLAALSYATFVQAAVLSIGTTALGTAILPYLSDMAARGAWAEIRASLRHHARLVFAVAGPLALLIAWLAEPVVRILYQRGEFAAEDTAAVASIFTLYIVGVPLYTVGVLCARVLASLRLNRIVLWAALGNLVLNVVGNVLLIRVMGVRGIALATTIVHLFVLVHLWLVASARLRRAQEGAPPAQGPTGYSA